jgi:hypothetical protein
LVRHELQDRTSLSGSAKHRTVLRMGWLMAARMVSRQNAVIVREPVASWTVNPYPPAISDGTKRGRRGGAARARTTCLKLNGNTG